MPMTIEFVASKKVLKSRLQILSIVAILAPFVFPSKIAKRSEELTAISDAESARGEIREPPIQGSCPHEPKA